MITGNLTPGYVELPLRGRPSLVLTMVDAGGAPVSVDGVYVEFKIYNSPDSITPLVSKDSNDGGGLTLVSPAVNGQVIVDLTAAEAALISAQRLYAFVATQASLDTDQIILTNTGHLIAAVNCINLAQQLTDAMALSTRFLNTPTLTDITGGVGYLDGIATASQSVPCQVEFIPSASPDSPPQRWVLEASSHADDPTNGFKRPLDYGAGNLKVWRQLS